ncbi:MAG TPA: hypothetical protein VGP84_04720, partial [Gemmatimonadaceae bacterium]|nr:hypothetical protein [Gemmatimonadaceae bacterium]
SPARAQREVSRAQLNGEWTGKLVLDNSQPVVTFVFALTDTSFAGTVYNDGTSMGAMEGGTLAGNRVHFTVGQLDFTGVITGARMKVDLIVYNGTTRTFTVTKTPETKPDTGLRLPIPQSRR